MNNKHWVKRAKETWTTSRVPTPHEVNELDWKSNLSENKTRLIEHLIAFANQTNGGFLVYGVKDHGLEGIDLSQSNVENIVNTLTNLARDAINPPLTLDHAIVEDENGLSLLFVYVAEQRSKPAHKRGKSVEETWIRSGGTTRKASRHDIGNLFLQSKGMSWEEIRASTFLTITEVIDLLDLPVIAKLLERPLPTEMPEIAHWLIDEKIIVAEGNGYYITNFGAIASARNLSQFDALSRKRIRIIQYRGTNKVETIFENIEQKGYAIGFEELISYIKRHLPHSEVIQQALRINVSMYPDITLRELIANTLIHQDFTITGAGPTIEIFEDRIEFTNPGALLPGKRPDRLIGTTPESRNELLASAFRRYRICEERGTGFQKVITAVELYGLPPVSFQEFENAFRVTIFSPRKFADMSQSERIEACYQHAVLQYLSSKSLSNASLRNRFKAHDKQRNQITNLIAEAVSAGRIKRKGSTKGKKFAEYLPYWA